MMITNELLLIKSKHLLSSAKRIIETNATIKALKGEEFNLFELMSMQYNEVNTHSSIIGELLNPKGSHLKGKAFLLEFLKIVYELELKTQEEQKAFNKKYKRYTTDTVNVETEYYIGLKNDETITGGRIDILIENGYDYLTIENKINAADQKLQLERYKNFNRNRNDVFYLTLFGKPADDVTKGCLEDNEYYVISYRDHITRWLERCMQLCYDQSTLREAIKQYYLLIKNITHQMDDSLKQQTNDLIRLNLKEASFIQANYYEVKNSIKESFRDAVVIALNDILDTEKFNIFKGNAINNKFAQIWIQPHHVEDPKVFYGIESFNGSEKSHMEGKLFCGVFNKSKNEDIAKQLRYDCEEWYLWPDWETLKLNTGDILNMSNVDCLEELLQGDNMTMYAKKLANTMKSIIDNYDAKVQLLNVS